MSVPTQGEQFAKLIEHLRAAQDTSAMLAHLTRSMSGSRKDKAVADGWIAVSELLKRMIYQVTALGQGKLQ
jgi:hypothetical protein